MSPACLQVRFDPYRSSILELFPIDEDVRRQLGTSQRITVRNLHTKSLYKVFYEQQVMDPKAITFNRDVLAILDVAIRTSVLVTEIKVTKSGVACVWTEKTGKFSS